MTRGMHNHPQICCLNISQSITRITMWLKTCDAYHRCQICIRVRIAHMLYRQTRMFSPREHSPTHPLTLISVMLSSRRIVFRNESKNDSLVTNSGTTIITSRSLSASILKRFMIGVKMKVHILCLHFYKNKSLKMENCQCRLLWHRMLSKNEIA